MVQWIIKIWRKFNILTIVGNKADLYEKEKFNKDEDEDELRVYSKEKKAVSMTASAKKGKILILYYTLSLYSKS